MYESNMGRGKVIYTNLEKAEWVYVVPETMGDQQFKALCNVK